MKKLNVLHCAGLALLLTLPGLSLAASQDSVLQAHALKSPDKIAVGQAVKTKTPKSAAKTTGAANQVITPVDVNTANVQQLQMINGIGKSKAEGIIKYREQHGKFSSIDELTGVRGISRAFLEKHKGEMTAS